MFHRHSTTATEAVNRDRRALETDHLRPLNTNARNTNQMTPTTTATTKTMPKSDFPSLLHISHMPILRLIRFACARPFTKEVFHPLVHIRIHICALLPA